VCVCVCVCAREEHPISPPVSQVHLLLMQSAAEKHLERA
jgi:hypothetical protein